MGLQAGCQSTGPVDRQPIWHIAVGRGRPDAKGEKHFELSVGRLGRPAKNREQAAFSRPTGRSTDRRAQKRARPRHKARSTGSVDRQFKIVFALCGRSTDRSTEPNGYMPNGLPIDRAGRPTAGLQPQRLFLLAQRPTTLVLMMINSCSYSTNDLVFN